MNAEERQHLQDAIVVLQLMDDGRQSCTPEAYRCAAASARHLVWEFLRRVPMHAFRNTFEALEATAENLYFEIHGRFADADFSGTAQGAQHGCDALIERLGAASRALRPCRIARSSPDAA